LRLRDVNARAWARVTPWWRGLLLAVALGFPVGLALLRSGMPAGHDAYEYLPRQVEFHENLRNGVLLPRWAPDLSHGNGEPLFLFSPPLVYFLAEAFHLIGSDYLLAMNLACLLLVLLSAGTAYALASEIVGGGRAGRFAGVAAGALYAWAPYLRVDLYVRYACAELASFPWIPLTLLGLVHIGRGRRRGVATASLGLALLALSHNPIVLLAVPLVAVATVITSTEARGARARLLALVRCIGSIGLGVLIAAFFLVPVLLEMDATKVGVLQSGYLDYVNHFVFPAQLLWSSWGYGGSVPGRGDGMSFAVGPVHLALGIVTLLVGVLLGREGEPGRHARRWGVALTGMGLFYLFITTPAAALVWKRVALLRYMSFPWRALAPATACLSIAGGLAASFLARVRFGAIGLAAGVLVLLALGIPQARPQGYRFIDLAEWTPAEIARRGLGATLEREFQPRGVLEQPEWRAERARLAAGQGTVESRERRPEREAIHIQAQSAVTVEVATLDFPGWVVRSAAGNIPHRSGPPCGRIVFDLPAGNHDVLVIYRRTPAQWAGLGLSVVGVVGLAVATRRRLWSMAVGSGAAR